MISEPLSIVLRAHNFSVEVASNGLIALDFCATKKYDVILLDIMMPLCNGIEFIKKANLSKNSPQTRIVLISNLVNGNEVKEGMKLGAHETVLKASITPTSLLQLINDQLAL